MKTYSSRIMHEMMDFMCVHYPVESRVIAELCVLCMVCTALCRHDTVGQAVNFDGHMHGVAHLQ